MNYWEYVSRNSNKITYTHTKTSEKSLTSTISTNISLKLSAEVKGIAFEAGVEKYSSLSSTVKNISTGAYSVEYDISQYSKEYEYKLVLVGNYDIHKYIHNGIDLIYRPYEVERYAFITNVSDSRIVLVAQKF